MFANQPLGDDQASVLRALAGEDMGRATSIAITSGKGGVGKTNIAVNLGIALAMRGLRVTLLDLDLGLANADVLMGLTASRNLAHVVAGECTVGEIIVHGPEGLRLVPGASGLERLANLSEFERHQILSQFQSLEADCDFLIMDLGAGISRNVIAFSCAADAILTVTTPEPTALADAYATIKMLTMENRSCDIELLVNQADSSKDARQAYERIARVASKFMNLPVASAGYILSDDAVTLAVRSRKPFVIGSPRSNASACVRALAKKYAHSVEAPAARDGFFRRVASLFQ